MVRCVLLWLPWLCAFAFADEELWQAVEDGNVTALQAQLEIWPEGVNATRSDGWTLLHVAAQHSPRQGRAEVVQLLLEKWPAGARARNLDGAIPLHWAALARSVDAWQLLLERWPEGMGTEDSAGRTPVHFLSDWCYVLSPPFVDVGPLLEAPESVAFLGSPESMSILGSESFMTHRSSGPCCGFVIEVGCRHQVSKPWMEAALNLQCMEIGSISKEELMHWLDCGGDIRFRDEQGRALVDMLSYDVGQYLQEVIASEGLLKVIAGDWRTWVSLGGAVIIAGAAVYLEELALKFLQRGQPSVREDPFLEGARLLVARACVQHMLLRNLWRWLEVWIAVIFSSFALVLVHWLWWLPLVALSYCIPAVARHGIRAVLRDPLLMLLTSSPINLSSKAAALLRTLALSGIFLLAFSSHNINVFFYRSYYHGWEFAISTSPESPWFISQFLGSFVQQKLNRTWQWSSLQDQFPWAPRVDARTLFVGMAIIIVCLVGLYVMCLLCGLLIDIVRLLGAPKCCSCCVGPPQYVQDVDIQQAAQSLLLKQPAEFHEVHAGIEPQVACAWPCRGSLYQALIFLLLDVFSDVNSIITFMSEQNYTFAAVMTFVVVRSTLKQMRILPPWRLRQAIKDTVHRGILRQDVLELFEEERRSESLFAACITACSLLFVVQTASQLLMQFVSLTLSTFMFSRYAVRVGDLNQKIQEVSSPPQSGSAAADVDVEVAGAEVTEGLEKSHVPDSSQAADWEISSEDLVI